MASPMLICFHLPSSFPALLSLLEMLGCYNSCRPYINLEKVIGFPKNINLGTVFRNFLCKRKNWFLGKVNVCPKSIDLWHIFKIIYGKKKTVNFFDNLLYLS